MTRLANQHGAVNLAQGFPDFDGPEFIKKAAENAMNSGENQYARMFGIPALNRAIAATWARDTGVEIDPETQVTVTSGCTEGIAAALLGILDPGDEVILFEPYYDSYRACIAMAGAVASPVTMRPIGAPNWSQTVSTSRFEFDPGALLSAISSKTRAVLVNTPHNPTGKVFTREELSQIAAVCLDHDLIAITDEVYERLTYGDLAHCRLATLPGMADRCITLSSLGKTFSLTGWKIGWAIARPALTRAVRAAHQFLTFATATPLQHGAAAALSSPEGQDYVRALVHQYKHARNYLSAALRDIGFVVYPCDGTYFIMVDHTPFGQSDDIAFCRYLTEKIGVAAIPPSVFYDNPAEGKRFARFAFCKKKETLERAVERLGKMKGG
jgi:aspartate/methionine/tyrosine aminotransferase